MALPVATSASPMELGLVGLVLLSFWKMLDVFKALYLNKRVDASEMPACASDPLYFQRVREIHEHAKNLDAQILHGDFSCQWKDRDEVRDFMEAVRAQTVASRQQTEAVTALTVEMRLTRNGGNSK